MESKYEDRLIIHSRKQWLLLFGFMVCLFGLPMVAGGKLIGIMNIIGITVIAVVGLQINVGYAGQVNMGQSAFMGVGAYTAGALTLHVNLPLYITIPAAGISAAIFGSIFGLAALRVKGFYLALTTIAAQFIFWFTMLKLPKNLFGQHEGLRLQPASLLGFKFDSDVRIYYLIFCVAVVMIYGAWGLVRSRTGRCLVAIRDNEKVADIIGIDVFYYKALAFFVGAFYAGVAGSLWGYYVRYIHADQFTLWLSVWYLGMLIMGGMGSILGAIIGTVGMRFLQELMTYLGPLISQMAMFSNSGGEIVFASMNMLLGAVIIAFVIFEPRGLVHRLQITRESLRLWPFPYEGR
jgi:branched-chain amino acid transport system permease protein